VKTINWTSLSSIFPNKAVCPDFKQSSEIFRNERLYNCHSRFWSDPLEIEKFTVENSNLPDLEFW